MSKQMLEAIQRSCTHRYPGGQWAINLQHNFPDGCPRGLCARCMTVIHPMQWVDAEPNQIKMVDAHPLYPVVEAMERRDHGRAVLDDAFAAAIDAAQYPDDYNLREGGFLSQINSVFVQARADIDNEFYQQAAKYSQGLVR